MGSGPEQDLPMDCMKGKGSEYRQRDAAFLELCLDWGKGRKKDHSWEGNTVGSKASIQWMLSSGTGCDF